MRSAARADRAGPPTAPRAARARPRGARRRVMSGAKVLVMGSSGSRRSCAPGRRTGRGGRWGRDDWPRGGARGPAGVPLAVIAGGTANDFARAHGLPRTAARRATWRARARRPAGAGTRAAGRRAPVREHRQRRAGPGGGALCEAAEAVRAAGLRGGAARAAATGRPLAARVRVDGAELFAGRAWQVIVACTGAFGGGIGMGAADATDGDLSVISPPARALGWPVAPGGCARGRSSARGRCRTRGAVVAVEAPEGAEFNCDGECGGGGLERVTAEGRARSGLWSRRNGARIEECTKGAERRPDGQLSCRTLVGWRPRRAGAGRQPATRGTPPMTRSMSARSSTSLRSSAKRKRVELRRGAR